MRLRQSFPITVIRAVVQLSTQTALALRFQTNYCTDMINPAVICHHQVCRCRPVTVTPEVAGPQAASSVIAGFAGRLSSLSAIPIAGLVASVQYSETISVTRHDGRGPDILVPLIV